MNKNKNNWRVLLALLLVLPSLVLFSQVHEEDKSWCRLTCDPEIHKENAILLQDMLKNNLDIAIDSLQIKRFPVRFVYVKKDTFNLTEETEEILKGTIDQLNVAFQNVGFVFYEEETAVLSSEIKLEDLSENNFNLYDTFSKKNDREKIITLYILDHKNQFCTVVDNSVSCSRIGGFSYILSGRTNNIVISQPDLRDPKIVAHEFGHFFGLYHTFESRLFGKDKLGEGKCHTTGDLICDTPPDPGSLFELYVNYSTCEMLGLKDQNGNEYSPRLDNYMSYYKPCYLKEYSFSHDQELMMKLAGKLPIRDQLSRKAK